MHRLAVVLLLGSASFATHAGDRITGAPFATRSEVIAQHGMVATSHPLATQVGLDVLKQGGTAIDAAIAANAALGLMEPVSNGVGGDLFAIVWDAKTKKLYGYNGSGRSPKSLPLQWFTEHAYKAIPPLGPLPVNVPGCVDALAKGSVGVIVNCPNIATCTAVTPQLIYTYLPVLPWYLSGTLTSDTSLLSQPNILAWSAVGVNDPQNDAQKNQFMTFAILNNSGANQVYTVTAYDKSGTVVGSKTTENVVSGQSIAQVLHTWMTGLPAGLLKVRVSGAGTSIATFLQFSGPAATALVPVAETPAP